MLTSSRSFVIDCRKEIKVGRATPTWWKYNIYMAGPRGKAQRGRRQADEISVYTRRIHPSNMDCSTLACWE